MDEIAETENLTWEKGEDGALIFTSVEEPEEKPVKEPEKKTEKRTIKTHEEEPQKKRKTEPEELDTDNTLNNLIVQALKSFLESNSK